VVKSGGKLLGEYSHNVDSKRRIFIPVDFRISTTWVLTAGLEKCLFLFPEDEWIKITEKISGLPLTKKDARSFLRVLLSRARSLSCDKQGRIIIPEKLAEYADISSSCTIIGMINRAELWNTENWQHFYAQSESNYSDLAESIAELDL